MVVQTLLIAAMIAGTTLSGQGAAAEPAGDGRETLMEVTGVVEIFSGGHGLGYVTLDDGRCYDLALPASVLKNSRRWDTKRVVITGSLQFRPRMAEMMWFDIKDRKIEGFGCSEDVIYVESIRKI